MKGLDWGDFVDRAQASICRGCECGFNRPWRDGATCQQAWLRFHATRGVILTCNRSHAARSATRPEEELMHEQSQHLRLGTEQA
jgi:hypothetical protein